MHNSWSKKLLSKILHPRSLGFFTQEEAMAKAMRLCVGKGGEVERGYLVTFFFLVDEEDGVVADAKFQSFAPPLLVAICEIVCGLTLRKNYLQVRRLSAELIEKEVGELPVEGLLYLNGILEAIDVATEGCMDIPIADAYVTPPSMKEGERHVYPGWEELTDTQKKEVVRQVVATDVAPYVELDAGGVEVLKVEDNRVTIAYSGSCTSCFSATGATLDAIGNILRHRIYPDLMVIPDLSTLQSS